MAKRTSPTVARRRLARELRRLHDLSGANREQVADHVGVSGVTIHRILTAETSAKVGDVKLMLEFYDSPEDEREVWLEVARQAKQRGWWSKHSTVIPEWLRLYIGLEAESTDQRIYQQGLVPALFQTEHYMRAVMAAHPRTTTERIEENVQLRQTRQELLKQEDPPRFWVILDEAVIRRIVGSPEIMREQLLHLVDLCSAPNITFQTLPFAAGAHAGMSGPFNILGFGHPHDPPTVYIPYDTGALYLEDEPELRSYTDIFNHLRAVAINPVESRRLIEDIAAGLAAEASP